MKPVFKHIRRVLILLIGLPILVIGLILIPVPGPGGLPVTLLGLLILSLEFEWARKRADQLKDKVKQIIADAKAKSSAIKKENDS